MYHPSSTLTHILLIGFMYCIATLPVVGQEAPKEQQWGIIASQKDSTTLTFPYFRKRFFKRAYIDEVLSDGCITKRLLTEDELHINSAYQLITFPVDAAAKSPREMANKPLLQCLLFSDHGITILLERAQRLVGGGFYCMIERTGLHYAMIVGEDCTSVVQFKITSLHPLICEEAILYDCCQQPSSDLY